MSQAPSEHSENELVASGLSAAAAGGAGTQSPGLAHTPQEACRDASPGQCPFPNISLDLRLCAHSQIGFTLFVSGLWPSAWATVGLEPRDLKIPEGLWAPQHSQLGLAGGLAADGGVLSPRGERSGIPENTQELGQALARLQVVTSSGRSQRRKLAPMFLAVLRGPRAVGLTHMHGPLSLVCARTPVIPAVWATGASAARPAGLLAPKGVFVEKTVGLPVVSLMSSQHLHRCHARAGAYLVQNA